MDAVIAQRRTDLGSTGSLQHSDEEQIRAEIGDEFSDTVPAMRNVVNTNLQQGMK